MILSSWKSAERRRDKAGASAAEMTPSAREPPAIRPPPPSPPAPGGQRTISE